MRTLLSLIILFSAAVLPSQNAYTGKELKPEFSILNIDTGSDFSTFSMLDSVVDRYTIFFSGENHGFPHTNRQFELKMLRYLHNKAGVKIHLMEAGASEAWVANRYIASGDSFYLGILKNYLQSTDVNFYKELYKYNQSLDSLQRIRIEGIDMDFGFSFPVKVLSLLLKDTIPPDSIALQIESIHGLAGYNDKKKQKKFESYRRNFGTSGVYKDYYSYKNTMDEVISSYRRHKELYRKMIKEDAELFDDLITSLEKGEKWLEYEFKSMMQGTVYREQYLYERFMKLVSSYPQEKFYGQFGRMHTARTKQEKWIVSYNFSALAARINQSADARVSGKVCSIGIYYPKDNHDFVYTKESEKIMPLVSKVRESSISLFSIESNPELKSFFGDKYQYLVINLSDRFGDMEDPGIDENIDEDDYLSDEVKTFYIYTHLEASYGGYYYKLNNLTDYLKTKGYISGSKPFLTALGVSVAIIGHELKPGPGGGLSAAYNHYTTTTLGKTDSSSVEMSGNTFLLYLLVNLTKNKFVDFIPRIGLGGGNMKLKANANYAPEKNLFNATQQSKYKNPVLLTDFSLETRVKHRIFSLGIKGGYQLDLSGKRWRTDDSLLESSPETDFSGPYGMITASVFFVN